MWLANRARNALRRPVFIGAVAAGTFVTAIVSMVVAPRTQREAQTPPPSLPRPDTLTVAAAAAMARVRLVEADSALAVARTDVAATAAERAASVPDSTAELRSAMRDSLLPRLARLDSARARAEQAPLPSSYRALANLPELRTDARVRALMDSLSEIERDREAFGAVGGVDPVFVALTSRANEIGRSLNAIAAERRAALAAALDRAPVEAPVVVDAAASDTAVRVAEVDSLRRELAATTAELDRRRAASHAVDLEEERARDLAGAVAPPLALLASAFVLSAVIGFAVAFVDELRRPRVSNPAELERFLGVRVLSTVESTMPSAERGRRQADRAAPPYFDPGAEGYQLAYLGLATEHPSVLSATVTGDDPLIAAVVACNLAAIAADEARNTLVLDLDPSCSASAALRARVLPGIVDIAGGSAAWPEATVSAPVGRDKAVDLVPHGLGTGDAAAVVALLRRDVARLVKYYDAVLLLADTATVEAGAAAAAPAAGVVYCAQPGTTALHRLREELDRIRAAGGVLRGVVLWNAERPLLPTPRELTARRGKSGKRGKSDPVPVAATAG